MRSASCNWRSRGRVTWLHCRHLLPDSEVRNGEILSPISGPKRLVGGSTRALRSLHHCLSARTAFRADIGSLPFRAQRSIRRPVIQAGIQFRSGQLLVYCTLVISAEGRGRSFGDPWLTFPYPLAPHAKNRGPNKAADVTLSYGSLSHGGREDYISAPLTLSRG